MENKRFYKVPEISRLTGIPRASLYVAIQRQEIKGAVTLGARIYVPAAEVARLPRLIGEPGSDDERGGGEAA